MIEADNYEEYREQEIELQEEKKTRRAKAKPKVSAATQAARERVLKKLADR